MSNNLIVILHDRVPVDAPPDQRDALVQAHSIATALATLGIRSVTLEFDDDLERSSRDLRSLSPSCVFNLVESVGGFGSAAYRIPAWLTDLGIPFTGAGSAALEITNNKVTTKQYLRRQGISVPSNFSARHADSSSRWIVKSALEDASLGLDNGSVVAATDVPARLALMISAFGGEWMAEQYIPGREFNVSLLDLSGELLVLPVAEICFKGFAIGEPCIVDYAAKWDEGSAAYQNTQRQFPDKHKHKVLFHQLERIARVCWQTFGLRGYARVDFRVDTSGNPLVLEVNANPCLSPDSGFVAALGEANIDFTAAIEGILSGAAAILPETSPPLALASRRG